MIRKTIIGLLETGVIFSSGCANKPTIKDYLAIGSYVIEERDYNELIAKIHKKNSAENLTLERWQVFAKAYDSNKDSFFSHEEFEHALVDAKLK